MAFKSLSETIYEFDFDCGKRFEVTQFLFSFVERPNIIYRYVGDFRDCDGDLLYVLASPSGNKFILASGRENDLIILRNVLERYESHRK